MQKVMMVARAGILILVCLACLLFETSCTSSDGAGGGSAPLAATTGADGGVEAADPSSPQGVAIARVVSLVNEQRTANGLGALSANAQLMAAAQAFAQAMATEGFFSHTAPDGSGPGDRITAAGYHWSTYGENIAWGYPTPEAVMDGWMNSSGHRANILGSGFREIGVGYFVSSDGSAYWVEDFGAR